MKFADLFDSIPWIARYRTSESGRIAERAIERAFAQKSRSERSEIFRGFARNVLLNRLIYRFHTQFIGAARVVGKLVRFRNAHLLRALVDGDRPILIAAMHFGPIFYQIQVLLRLTGDRPVYVLYAERGRDRESCERFMQAIGTTSIFDEGLVGRRMIQIMRADPRAIMIIAYDHLSNGKRPIPFLSTSVDVSDGVGYVADLAQVPAITIFWEWRGLIPTMNFGGVYELDAALPSVERRTAFVDELYRRLEERVGVNPTQWTQWPYISGAAAASPAEPDL